MHYLTVSFTHKNTDIAIREKLSFNSEEKSTNFMSKLKVCNEINEVILLSTCNRVEIIVSASDCGTSLNYIFDLLSYVSDVPKDELEGRADVYEDNGAIHHLFTVCSSLDSLVIGETQIAGQLKDAFKYAFEQGYCGQKLGRAMHYAFRCAAEVRGRTDISKNPVSVSSVAVSKAKDLLGNLGGLTALVVGAGEMSQLAAKHLVASGVNIIIINRNIEHAQALANELGELASVAPYAKLTEYINRYRLVFTATGAPHSVITNDMVEEREFSRYWFDIAVPRDIEVKGHENLHVFAVDDLEEIVAKNMSMREEQAKVAYSIVGRSTMDFFKWLQSMCVEPIIKEIRDHAKCCSQQELEKAIKKGYIPETLQEQVEKVLHHAFNSFLHTATKNLKDVAERPEADTVVQAVQYIFDINEDQTKRMNMYKCEYQMGVMK
ncbi:MAG: glutamyl-tRNA reductase [Sulfurospirillaceae bacterium]|nr:glutamyl-tRNA reductase [Sulfurospirillaceae bacterium]